MKKKILAILLTITTLCATLFSASVSVSAAAKNPWDYSATPTRAIYYKSPVMTGNDVKWVQQSLNIVMSSNLSVDGSAGPATKKAILSYQKKYNLTQDGSFGPASRKKMVSLLNGKGYYENKAYIIVYKGINSVDNGICMTNKGGSAKLQVKSSSSWSVSSNVSWLSVKKKSNEIQIYCKSTLGKNKKTANIVINNSEGVSKKIKVTQFGVYTKSNTSDHKHSGSYHLYFSINDTADMVFTSVRVCDTCGYIFSETANSWTPPLDM